MSVKLKDKGSLGSIIISTNMPTTAGGLQQIDTWKLQENGLVMVQVGSDSPWHAPKWTHMVVVVLFGCKNRATYLSLPIALQELNVTNLKNCRSCLTVRKWRRVPTLLEDVQALSMLLKEEKGSLLTP